MSYLSVKIEQNSDTYGEIQQIKTLLSKRPWYKLQKMTAKQVVALAVAEYRDKLLSEAEYLDKLSAEKQS